MKKKYIAMTALLCWLAVSGWLASMVVAKPAVLFIGNNAEESAEAARLRASLQRNKLVLETAATLRPQPRFEGSQLIAVPDSPAAGSAGPASNGVADADTLSLVPASLSLVVTADGRSTAIINGMPVRQGARLDDGTRVLAIGSNWARVRSPAGEVSTLRVRHIGQSPEAAGASR
ncbi:MAG: hypothetical protein ACN6OR_11475 [Stenotrophomonas sp.]